MRGYLLPKGLCPSLTSGWPGRNPWLGGRLPGPGGGAGPDPGPVTTEPPGPKVVCTGVLYPVLERPGEGAVDPGPRPGLVKVEDGGREPEAAGGPLEEPGRPGLGLNAMGLMTTFP